ncbi:MAG: NAD(P)-binding protein [Deltaproteobacteria bacterium]|nr:NAD(P)-binding protein [Deltaproteobacteria bacterium]
MYDFIIIGAGMGGLTVGSLLAQVGKKVCLVEALKKPGGCAHSFKKGDFSFCASVHYLHIEGKENYLDELLKKLNLENEILLERLDPSACDVFSCPSQKLRFTLPNKTEKFYPKKHFRHFVQSMAHRIEHTAGCCVSYKTQISKVHISRGKIHSISTTDGREFSGKNFIVNMDAQKFSKMMGPHHFPKSFQEKLQYHYSTSAYSVYLGMEGINLSDYGFGKNLVWHSPHFDVRKVFHRGQKECDLKNPWFLMSTPSLYSASEDDSMCPKGACILQIVTTCRYELFANALRQGEDSYSHLKNLVLNSILDVVETFYIPNLRKHLKQITAGTPTTHARQ